MKTAVFLSGLLLGVVSDGAMAQPSGMASCMDIGGIEPVILEHRVRGLSGEDFGWTLTTLRATEDNRVSFSRSMVHADGVELFRQDFWLNPKDHLEFRGRLTSGEHTTFDLSSDGSRVRGQAMLRGGEIVSVDMEALNVVVPGAVPLLATAVDWTKCDTMTWKAFFPPSTIYEVTARRVAVEPYLLFDKPIEVVLIDVAERSGVSRLWITIVAPHVVVKDSASWGSSVLTKLVKD